MAILFLDSYTCCIVSVMVHRTGGRHIVIKHPYASTSLFAVSIISALMIFYNFYANTVQEIILKQMFKGVVPSPLKDSLPFTKKTCISLRP